MKYHEIYYIIQYSLIPSNLTLRRPSVHLHLFCKWRKQTWADLGRAVALCFSQAACFVPMTQHMVVTLDSNHLQRSCNLPTLR